MHPGPDSGINTSPYRLIVRRFDVSDTDILLSAGEAASEVQRRITSINGRASLRVGRSMALKIVQLAFQLDPGNLDVLECSGEIDYAPRTGRVEISHWHLKTPASDMDADVKIDAAAQNPGIDLSADIAALSVSEMEKLLFLQLPAKFAYPEAVSGKIQLKGRLAELEHRIQLSIGESLVQSAGRIDLDPDGGYGAGLHAKIRRFDSALIPFPALKDYPALINADLSMDLQHVTTPDAKGNISVSLFDSRIAEQEVKTLKMEASVSGPDLNVSDLTIRTPGGGLEASGAIDGILFPDLDKKIRLTAQLQHLDTEALFKGIRFKSDLNFDVNADVRIPAGLDPAGISANVLCTAASSEIAGLAFEQADIDANWENGQVEVRKFNLSGKMGSANGSGRICVPEGTCRLSAAMQIPEMALWKPYLPDIAAVQGLSGRVFLTGGMEGHWRHPSIHAVASAESVAVSGLFSRKMDAYAQWDGNLSDFRLSGKCDMADFKMGHILISELSLETRATPEGADLELNLGHQSGQVLHLKGRVTDVVKPVKQILISSVEVSSPDLAPLTSQGPIRAVLSPERITVAPAIMRSGDAVAEFSANIGRTPDRPLAADLRLQGIDIARLAKILDVKKDMSGIVSGDIRLSGSAGAPAIDMQLALARPVFESLSFSEMSLVFSWKKARALFEMNADGGGERIVSVHGGAGGRVSLYPFIFSPDYDQVEVLCDLFNMDLQQLASLWPKPMPLQGRISGNARLTGAADTLKLAVEATAEDIVYRKMGVNRLSASLFYQDENARMAASGFRDGRQIIDMHGVAPVRVSLVPFLAESAGEGLDADIALNGIDVSEISNMLDHPEIDAGGQLAIYAKMNGDIKNPRIEGRVLLGDGFLTLKKQGLSYEKMSAEIAFDPDGFDITQVNISGDKEGELSLSGRMEAAGFRPEKLDITATGKNFYVPFYAGIDAWGDPDLKLTGVLSAPVLTGTILVRKGRVNTEALFGNAPSEIRVIEPERDENGVFRVPEENPEALSFTGPLAADVLLTIPRNVWIRGKEESIEIRGGIHLKKEPGASFVLYGPLQAVRGTYRFRNRLFRITSGDLQFIGQEEINPPLNIEAETRIEDVRIITRLTGTFDRMKMELSSDPAMDQTDIISYLIFGQPTDALSEGESFRAGEAALGMTGQFAADELREILGEKLSFDYIGVSAGSEGFRDGSVSMGKYITPKVFVIYRYGFSEETPQQVEVNYEINRNFSLETEMDNERTSAVDLIWKYDF